MKLRLDKYLADLGYGSRKEIQQLIKQNRVHVNGLNVPASTHITNEDKVYVDHELVYYEEAIYILLNKPIGYICDLKPQLYPSAMDLIEHPQKKSLFFVGRLDKDTTGALLITNDGKLDHRLRRLKSHVDKVYVVKLLKPFDARFISEIEQGIALNENEICAPAKIKIIDEYQIELILQEGKYHQVKRMMHACDNEVVALHRSHFSFLNVDDLALGESKYLSEQEIRRLKQ